MGKCFDKKHVPRRKVVGDEKVGKARTSAEIL